MSSAETIATGFTARAEPSWAPSPARPATSRATEHDGRDRSRLEDAASAAAPWHVERERRRLLEARRRERGGDALGPLREGAAGAAAAEMSVEERGLELGELAVDTQR